MIQHSPLWEEAVRYSHTMKTTVDIYVGTTKIYSDIPVIDGSVKCDAGAKVRWTASLSVALYEPFGLPLIQSNTCRMKIYRSLTSIGYTETIQLGEYRIDDVSRSGDGKMGLSGSGLEAYVVDNRFLQPRTPPRGASTASTITTLINESVPGGATVLPRMTKDKRVDATAPWARERIDAVNILGDSINADVFCNNAGVFVIEDKPVVTRKVAVFHVRPGEGQTLTSEEFKTSRDKSFNAVSVTGKALKQTDPPIWAASYDLNPASPTYWGGQFGKKPKFYSSQFLTTTAQAQNTANNMLIKALNVAFPINFGALPLAFLEANDVIQLTLSNGSTGKYVLEDVSYDLSNKGTMKATTYAAELTGE